MQNILRLNDDQMGIVIYGGIVTNMLRQHNYYNGQVTNKCSYIILCIISSGIPHTLHICKGIELCITLPLITER